MNEHENSQCHDILDSLGIENRNGMIHLSVLDRLRKIQPSSLVNENPVLPKTNREQILLEAIKCVTKDRNATHGDPEDNFTHIGHYWTNYLIAKGVITKEQIIGPEDVAAMMILMKISRLATSPEHMDHWIDIAGYAACGGGIAVNKNVDNA